MGLLFENEHMINRILRRIKALMARFNEPVMIYGFKSADGNYRKGTRYSSTVSFQYKSRIVMGDRVYIAHFSVLDGSNGLEIGEGCQIASWVTITSHSSHISLRLYGKRYGGTEMIGYKKGKIKIGAYSFIGPHSIVMPDTVIGKGSLISAFSMVKGTFPDFAIVSGNPAVVVGDTRDIDAPFLQNYPELRESYKEWSGVDITDWKS